MLFRMANILKFKMRVLISLFFLLLTLSSFSYSQINFIIAPLKTYHKFQPGKPGTGTFIIESFSDKVTNITVSVADFDIDEEKGEVNLETKTHKNSLIKYISISPQKFDLKPHHKQKIRYTINLPKDARGSFWCVVFFKSKPTERIRGTGIKIAARIGSYVFQTTPNSTPKLSLSKIAADKENFIVTITNSGEAIAVPEIVAKIIDAKGKVIQAKNIENKVAFPDKKRVFKIKPDIEDITPGNYNLEVLVLHDKIKLKETVKFVIKREMGEMQIEMRD